MNNIAMDYRMEIFTLILCVIPAIVTSITITSNGNSPEVKLKGGMMVDLKDGFVPISSKFEQLASKNSVEKAKTHKNSTKLSINERYRRLIPYMTFYYANDLATPTTSSTQDVEVEKAEIIQELHQADQREPKKIIYSHRNIPRYQGNRLTQHNIASANPTKFYYKRPQIYQISNNEYQTQNYNPLISEYKVLVANDFDSSRFIPKQTPKTPSIFVSPTRKPYLNIYNEDTPNIRYYLSEKDQTPKYKLVPYEQTPPIQVAPQNDDVYDITKKPIPVSVLIPKEPVYLKPRPARPHYVYENVNVQPTAIRKQPLIVSESYFEKQRPPTSLVQPVIHSGFKPIVNAPPFSTEVPTYTTSIPETISGDVEHMKHGGNVETASPIPSSEFRPNYYEYVIEQTTYKPAPVTSSNTASLASLLDSLQLNKSIPKPITKENVGSSIRTLLQVLNALKAVPQDDVVAAPVLSTPTPFVANKNSVEIAAKPVANTAAPPSHDSAEDLHEEPYLAQVNTPSQHLDDYPSDGGTSQRFPPPVTSDDEGGTPGRPGVDYPILTVIPSTSFDCKTQRYKGFFADTETRCQVWHYCDLNGGQASFLCPNGTIFSQAALTCDWWFNVRCASTPQLYVLNESLYKYILPHSPKFPEDYSGPLVDKYLTLKFKEMEEQFKKNKSKQASEKMDGDDKSSEDSEEEESSSENTDTGDKVNNDKSSIDESSVIVESPGTSGKVERLEE